MNLKRIIFSLIVALGFAFSSYADFVLVQRAANPYRLVSEDVFALDLMSTESQAVNIKFYGIIKKDGKKVVELESRPISISPGANSLSVFNVPVFRKNYINKNVLEVERLTTMLPLAIMSYAFI